MKVKFLAKQPTFGDCHSMSLLSVLLDTQWAGRQALDLALSKPLVFLHSLLHVKTLGGSGLGVTCEQAGALPLKASRECGSQEGAPAALLCQNQTSRHLLPLGHSQDGPCSWVSVNPPQEL